MCAGSAIGVGAYFNRIRTPQLGESGGLPSHTPAYYSIDFGRTHIVCLDSMMSNTTREWTTCLCARMLHLIMLDPPSQDTAVKQSGSVRISLLQKPLVHSTGSSQFGTTRPTRTSRLQSPSAVSVLVVIHSRRKGLFDSDWYKAIVVMRVVFMPIIESHGVDIVLTAHAHGYERSHLIDGHYHNASYFSERNMVCELVDVPSTTHHSMVMVLQVRRGTGSVSDPYQKPQGIHGHQGTVIVVSGNGGYVTEKEYGMMHPAMGEPSSPLCFFNIE